MSLGTGIFASTVLLLFAAALYQITIRQKWKTVGKVFVGVVLVGLVTAGGIWGWTIYSERPSVVTELSGVRLGMNPLEVKLAKGAPATENQPSQQEDGEFQITWVYSLDDNAEEHTLVIFRGEKAEATSVAIVCESGGYSRVLGFGRFDSEKDVLEKLGPPTNESIRQNGLSKVISYKPWKVAYEIEKGLVADRCISESGKVSYTAEYGKAEKAKTQNTE